MILTILFGVVGFGIMVFVHELGHFIAAKRAGIAVETFSLGWGKKLVGFDYKGTNYRISMIPLGGYCRMKGEDPARLEEVQDKKGAFLAAPPWKRILVAASGPTANVLFALLVLTTIWWVGFKTYSDGNRIVLQSDYPLNNPVAESPAAKAGLETGDRIVAINGQEVTNFQQILESVATSPDSPLKLTVQRDGRTLSLSVDPQLDLNTGAGRIGVYAWRDPVVDRVAAGGAAALAGLRKGDRIVAVDGSPTPNTIALYQALVKRPGQVQVRYERAGQTHTTPLVLSYTDQGEPQLGLSFRLNAYPSPTVGFFGAVDRGAKETWQTLALSVKGIGLLFRGVNLRNAVAGPLRITYYVGSVATSGFAFGVSQGLVDYFRFLALLSVVLFMINLLPIPALDGGQVLVFLIEVARRKPLAPKIIARIQTISFSVIILLAVFITFSDILFFAGK
jgi:regulator of sigma E protease